MEHLLLLRALSAHRLCLRESCSIHVFEKLVLLSELVFKDLQLRAYLSVLISEAVDLNLCVHVLLI